MRFLAPGHQFNWYKIKKHTGEPPMDSIHSKNTNLKSLTLIDKIDEHLLKAQSITSCLLAVKCTDSNICNRYWYGALWSIDSYLDELAILFSRLEKMTEISK